MKHIIWKAKDNAVKGFCVVDAMDEYADMILKSYISEGCNPVGVMPVDDFIEIDFEDAADLCEGSSWYMMNGREYGKSLRRDEDLDEYVRWDWGDGEHTYQATIETLEAANYDGKGEKIERIMETMKHASWAMTTRIPRATGIKKVTEHHGDKLVALTIEMSHAAEEFRLRNIDWRISVTRRHWRKEYV